MGAAQPVERRGKAKPGCAVEKEMEGKTDVTFSTKSLRAWKMAVWGRRDSHRLPGSSQTGAWDHQAVDLPQFWFVPEWSPRPLTEPHHGCRTPS